ncbi:hypothetical protein ACFLZ6_01315 [Nanoarchaeota archaeon]
MRKLIIVLVVISLLLLAGCEYESEEEKQARVNISIEKCSSVTSKDDYDIALCLAEEAVRWAEQGKDHVRDLCKKTGNQERRYICYFYSAIMTNQGHFCNSAGDHAGCKMIAYNGFCSQMQNRNQCIDDQVFFMSLLNKSRSKAICDLYFEPSEYMGSCLEIDFDEPDEGTLRERFILMRSALSLADLEVRVLN